MAKGTKTGGRNFKPGNNANPKGRPPISPEVKAMRKLTTESFIKLCNDLLFSDAAYIQRKLDNPDTPMIELAMLNMLKNMAQGDSSLFEMFMNRTIGKVPDKVQTTQMSYLEYLQTLAKEEDK